MENSTLYQQKVTLLSRLVKENAVTFEEALLLLKNDDLDKQDPPEVGVIPTRFKLTDSTSSYQTTMPIFFSTPAVENNRYWFHIPPSGTISTSNDSIFTINTAADLNT